MNSNFFNWMESQVGFTTYFDVMVKVYDVLREHPEWLLDNEMSEEETKKIRKMYLELIIKMDQQLGLYE